MGERGFTLVELLVAMFILLVSMGASLSLLDGANATTSRTKAREQGVALQRELVEAARSVPYESLVPGAVTQSSPPSVAARVRDVVGGDTAGGWTVDRRDVQYSVSVGVCSVDDPRDGRGTADAASFCASGAGTQATATTCGPVIESGATSGDCGVDVNGDGSPDGLHGVPEGNCTSGASCADRNPDDYKRVVTLVTWQRDGRIGYARQSSTVVNPGLSAGPPVVSFSMTEPFNSPTPPTIEDPLRTNLKFSASTGTRVVSSLAWSVDGTQEGTATDTGGGTSWAFQWQIGTPQDIVDGVYVVGARAFNSYGVSGPGKAVTVELNRAAPFAPKFFLAGRNKNLATDADLVEFRWTANRERDILGYRVRAQGGTVSLCGEPSPSVVTCQANVPSDAGTVYEIVALDSDGGVTRQGEVSTDTVATYSRPLPPPSADVATGVDGEVIRWSLSTSPGIIGYRIYRNGVLFKDRINLLASDQVTFTDGAPGATQPTYYVTAVNSELAESTPVQAVRN